MVISPQRAKRPWQGQVEKTGGDATPRFDPKNPLCPGVTRPNGQVSQSILCVLVLASANPFTGVLGVQIRGMYMYRPRGIPSLGTYRQRLVQVPNLCVRSMNKLSCVHTLLVSGSQCSLSLILLRP